MINVTVFYKEENEVLNSILVDLEEIKNKLEFEITKIDILSESSLYERYKNSVPVIVVGPYQIKTPANRQDMEITIQAAIDRQKKLLENDANYKKRLELNNTVTASDRFTVWISKTYIYFICAIIIIYSGLPFMAPVFMKNRMELPANIIYSVYSTVCHQLAYRSFFLFGEQYYYPRQLANIPAQITFETATGIDPTNIQDSKNFIGNDKLGYKVAFCERDTAIYASILLFGIIFIISKRKIKGIPWYVWIIIGMIPMGLDGGIQLFSYIKMVLPIWVPLYESSPLMRVITGGLFGFSMAWYIFPIIEESMLDSRSSVVSKMAVIKAKNESRLKNAV